MKQLLIYIFFLVTFSSPVLAQDKDTVEYNNNVQIAPLALFGKVHLSYEHTVAWHFTLGIGAHYYYPDLYMPEDFKFELFGRFYTQKEKCDYGFFVNPFFAAGAQVHDPNVPGFHIFNLTEGGGLLAGYKLFILKKEAGNHIPMEFAFGFQYYPYPTPNGDIGALGWYLAGPGSLLVGRFSVGYAF